MLTTFTINNHKWVVELKKGEELLEEYLKRNNQGYMCNGLTFYRKHKIWIAKEMCYDEIIRTIKHELTHCYIWEMGFYNVDFNYEEIVCDFVASIYSFIEEIINKIDYINDEGESI